MANRYWVGGTGTWDATVGTKWAATSGGPGGETVPTAADDVFFDAASGANTVTISGTRPCLSFNATGFTGTLAGTATPILQINASLTLGSGMTVAGTLTTVSFVGTTATRTITSNGISLINVTVATTSTNTLTLQDNLTVTTNFTLTTGVLQLDTRTLQAATFTNTSTSTRTLNFGTGKLRLTGSGTVYNGVITGLTTLGTTKIVEPSLGAAQTITPGALTEANAFDISVPNTAGNFTLTLTAGRYHDLTFANATYTVANTALSVYGNLSIAGTSPTFTAGTNAWTFASASSTQTITTSGETLDFPITINGANTTVQLQDALTMGAGRTLTLTDGTLDIQSYTLTLGGFSSSNSNTRTIAFGTGKMVFNATGTITAWTTATVTNLTITGSKVLESTAPASGTKTFTFGAIPEASTLDLTVITGGGAGTVTISGNVNNLVFQNATYTIGNGATNIFGNFTVSGTSPTFASGANAYTMSATSGTKTITTSGETLQMPFALSGSGGTFNFQDSLTTTSDFTFTNGTANLSSYTLTCRTFNSSNSNVRTFNFGTGKVVTTGSGVGVNAITMTTSTNFAATGTKLIEVIYNGGTTLNGGTGVTEANTLNVSVIPGVGSGSPVIFLGRYNNLSLDGTNLQINTSSAPVIYGDLTASASINWGFAQGATLAWTFAATSGTKTITTNGGVLYINLTFNGVGGTWQLGDALTVFGDATVTLTNGTFATNNYSLSMGEFVSTSGTRTVNFGTTIPIITSTVSGANAINIAGTSTLTIVGNWAFKFQGNATRILSSATEDKTFDLYCSFGSGNSTCYINADCNIKSLTIEGDNSIYGNLMFENNVRLNIYGDLIVNNANWLGSVFASSGSAPQIFFKSTSGTTRSIDTKNTTRIQGVFDFDGVGGSWRFDSNFSNASNSDNYVRLTAGTLSINTYTVSVNRFVTEGVASRTINFNSGTLKMLRDDSYNGGSDVCIFTENTGGLLTINPGTGILEFAASSGTCTLLSGTGAGVVPGWTVPKIRNSTACTVLINSSGYSNIEDLESTLVGTNTFQFPAGSTTKFNKFTLNPTPSGGSRIQTEGNAAATHYLVLNSGIADAGGLQIQWSDATPATNTWYAGASSTDVGNNTGWIFADAPESSGNMLLMFS